MTAIDFDPYDSNPYLLPLAVTAANLCGYLYVNRAVLDSKAALGSQHYTGWDGGIKLWLDREILVPPRRSQTAPHRHLGVSRRFVCCVL